MWGLIVRNWKIVLILILGASLYISVNSTLSNRSKYLREKNNVSALLDTIIHSRTSKGEDVATIKELQLTVSEFKSQMGKDADLIKELSIRPPQIKEIIKTVTETKIEYRDTVMYVKDSVINWNKGTEWWSVDQQIKLTSDRVFIDLKLITRDSLSHILFAVPKCKFLGVRLGVSHYEIKVVNHNPDSKIVYTKWINVSKDKKMRKR